MCPKVIEVITKNTQDKKTLRLAILNTMYNMYTDSHWRYSIFVAILEYALATAQTAAVDSQFETLEDRMKEWNVNPVQKRHLYDLVIKHLDDYSLEVYDYLIKYLSTYEEDGQQLTEAKERVKSIIISLIKDQEIIKTDKLLELRVVDQLKHDTQHALVHRLLEIFTTEGYKEYIEFYNGNQNFFQAEGLDHERLSTKIRFLSLNSLASTKSSIQYAEAARVMGVDESEVEITLVEAISGGFLDAKLDQLQKQIVVRTAESRVFKQEQWQLLDKKLTIWKQNLRELLSVIHTAKGTGPLAETK